MNFIRILLSCLLLTLWSTLIGTSTAQTATISANPNPCVLASSTSTCVSSISFSTSNAPNAGLFFGTTLVVGTSSGTYAPNWINVNGYTFDVRADRNDVNSTKLASVFVRGVLPSGTISASPQSCVVPSGGICSTTISWNTQNISSASVWVTDSRYPNNAPGNFSNGTSGSAQAPWIQAATYTFYLRNGTAWSSPELARVSVSGTAAAPPSPSATISANPNPCLLASSSSNCTSTISYAATNAPNAGLFFGSTLVVGTASGTYMPNWINVNGQRFDVRLDRNNPASQVLATVFVQGVVPSNPSPSCSSVSPQASTTTATSGSFRIYAYGVANATSVTFPTWGNPGGQDDLVWYNGVNAGGGTWYADVNLANHKANAPEYGAFYSDVYLNNASQSNVYCGRASWSRSQPQLAAYAAEFVSQTVPTSMVAGNTYSVAVTMNNTGANTWTTADGYKLGSVNPYDNFTWGLQRVDVPSNIASGAQATFSFNVTAPTTPGTYNFQWRMLREGVQWFGNATTNVTIQVNAPSANTGTIRYLGYYYSGRVSTLPGGPGTGGGDAYFDTGPEFTDHGNIAFASADGSYYGSDLSRRNTFINNAVRFVSDAALRTVGNGNGRMKTILEVNPIFFPGRSSACRTASCYAQAASLNPNASADWRVLIDTLAQANQLDNVAAFYFVDEPNYGADSTTVCNAISAMKAYQLGRNIPIATTFGNTTFSPTMTCYDWIGLDDYRFPAEDFFDREVCFENDQGPICSIRQGLMGAIKTNLRPEQRMFIVPAAAGPGDNGGTVGYQDPKVMFNGAVSMNSAGGAQIIGLIPYVWKVDGVGVGFDTSGYFKPTWNQIGRRILSGNMTPLP